MPGADDNHIVVSHSAKPLPAANQASRHEVATLPSRHKPKFVPIYCSAVDIASAISLLFSQAFAPIMTAAWDRGLRVALGGGRIRKKAPPARERALDGAVRCFAQHGVRKTNMADVAAAAGTGVR